MVLGWCLKVTACHENQGRLMDRPYLPPFATLRAFEAFGRHRGVRKTAAALGVDHAIVSRHLRSLEDWLGVMLVDRSTWQMTAAGEAYHALISPAFDQLCSATQQARRLPSVRLEVWSTPGIAYLWITGRLREYQLRFPGAVIDLRPTDASPDLLRREAHADIRWIADHNSHRIPELPARLTRMELVRPRIFPVARPDAAWLQGRTIEQPADLPGLPLLFEQDASEWVAWLGAHGVRTEVPASSPRLWQAHMTLAAAREGQGVALTNAFLAADDLLAGRLIEIGRTATRVPPAQSLGAYYLIVREDEQNLPWVARFRDWLLETVADCPPDWTA